METLLSTQTTVFDKMVTPSRDLRLPQPIGGPNRHAVRLLSGYSSS